MKIEFESSDLEERFKAGNLEEGLLGRIKDDNIRLCSAFKGFFDQDEIVDLSEDIFRETYLNAITTEQREKKVGWGNVNSYLKEFKRGKKIKKVEAEPVHIFVRNIREDDITGGNLDDFDLIAHITSEFNLMSEGGMGQSGMQDPPGEGDLRHRRTCVWEP